MNTLLYTLQCEVDNGSVMPKSVCVDVDFGNDGILVIGNRPVFLGADLKKAGLPDSAANTFTDETPASVLAHALRITDDRVSFDAEKHPRLVAAIGGDLDALDTRVWEKRKRDEQNDFLRQHGYRWEKQSFYVSGDIGDTVSRWFLFDAAGKAIVGARPGIGGIETFGNLERLLTELGFYGDAAQAEQIAADLRHAERTAAWKIVDAANLTLGNDEVTLAAVPDEVDMFYISYQARDTYGIAPDAIWVKCWCHWDRDFTEARIPYDAQVAEALQTLRR